MSASKLQRLLVVALALFVAVGAVADAFALERCCSQECTSDFCPLQLARAARGPQKQKIDEPPSCHAQAKPDAAASQAAETTARNAAKHGQPKLDTPSRRCVESYATGGNVQFVADSAPGSETPDRVVGTIEREETAQRVGGWRLAPASRGPPRA